MGCEKNFLGGVGDLLRRSGIFKEERGILRKMRVFKEERGDLKKDEGL